MTSRRALVTLPDGVWEIIDKELKGKIGDGDSEVIRNLVIAHLTEKGYLMKPKKGPIQIDQLADELDMHDVMLSSLAEVLEERGQLNASEWEKRIKKKIAAESANRP